MAGIVNNPAPTPIPVPIIAPTSKSVDKTSDLEQRINAEVEMNLIHPDGFNYHAKAWFNDPPDKKLCWRGPLAEKRGQLADWPVYTEAMLKQDRKLFGTMLAQPYRLEGNRMVNGISWLVFRPIELHNRQEEARLKRQELTMRTFPEGQRGKSKLVAKGHKQFDVSQEARED
jgi:hypothetical protein